MADLRRIRDERGQLLLIAAFALAALFITLAVILNAVIYTENLATRTDSRTSDAVANTQSVERATVDLLGYVNEHNTSIGTNYNDLKDDFERGFGNFTEGLGRYQLTSGAVVDGVIRTEYEGTWLRQTNESRNFTNRNLAANWSPVNGSAGGARSFRIKVQDTSSLVSSSTGAFTVNASDGTDHWELVVNSTHVQVTDADGNTDPCAIGSGTVWVNVSEGTVDGSACNPLDFGGDLETIQVIDFENADHIVGTFRVMVNKSQANVDSGSHDFHSTDEGLPFTEVTLYGARIGVDYETTSLVYRTDSRVVPGDTHD